MKTQRIHNTVYYWKGGTEWGTWKGTLITPDQIDDTLAKLRKAGYHAVPGHLSIGPPDGPPYSAAYLGKDEDQS